MASNNGFEIPANFINDFDDDNELSYHHIVPSIIDDLDWKDMKEIICGMDLKPGMNLVDLRKAQDAKKLVLSLRRKLIKENLIARAPYKGNRFYICSKTEFQRKAATFIEETDTYNFINEVSLTDPKVSQECLKKIMKQIDTTLDDLLHFKSITDQQYILMHHKRSNLIRLNYLHFVPDLHKEGEPLQPIIICKHSPTMHIIRYLTRILCSMFNQITGCKIFMDSADIVYALEQYVKNDYLQKNTHFVTFNINDICARFPHEIAIKVLENFLAIHGSEFEMVSEGLTNETIIKLVCLVLQNQFFIYENKLYQQMYGSASGSLLTIPLACFYLFYGQSSLLIDTLIKHKNELFGRYRNDIFLTWNNSKDQLLTWFYETIVNEQYSNVASVKPTIGSTIRLLDLQLGHDNKGHLHTKIYRDPSTDDYELPDRFQCHTCEPSSLLKAALNHAVQCCSTENDFQDERRHLELSHLMRDFSPPFLEESIDEFYNENGIKTDNCFLYPIIPYQNLRQHVLDNYEQQIALKQQQQQQNKNIIRIPYRENSDKQMIFQLQNGISNLFKKQFGNEQTFNNIQFEMVSRPETPLSLGDYLVDKRPPVRILTLSNDYDDEKHQ